MHHINHQSVVEEIRDSKTIIVRQKMKSKKSRSSRGLFSSSIEIRVTTGHNTLLHTVRLVILIFLHNSGY